MGQEGLDPLVKVTSREGTIHTLGSALINKWQKAWVLRKAELDNEDNDNKQKKLDLGKICPKSNFPRLLARETNFNML